MQIWMKGRLGEGRFMIIAMDSQENEFTRVKNFKDMS